MQRWIVLGAVALIVAGGGAFAFWIKRENSPDRIWVPLTFNASTGSTEKESLQKQVDATLRKERVLASVVKDLALVERFGVSSEEAAVAELSRRLFVEVGPANPPGVLTEALNIGVQGKRKERILLKEISTRLMNELAPMMRKSPAAPAPAPAPTPAAF